MKEIFSLAYLNVTPVSVQDGILVPKKAHTRSAPPINSLTKVVLKKFFG